MGIGESLRLSAFYIAVALAFGVWIWMEKGADLGMKYYTGFFIEKALSIDNVFVISLIFTYFAIPARYQYRALLWGIMAVIVLRGAMIAAGAALVSEFYWTLYIFAAFLIATGIRMLWASDHQPDIANNPVVRWLSSHMRITKELHGARFFVTERDEASGRMVRAATPLFLALVVINLADLVFAVDSVPAIFAITTDSFIVYTSNIMAILGLRALYFALAAMVHRFHYLKYALALVLVFIGTKIFIGDFLMESGKIPPLFSLGVTFALILGGIGWSLWKTRQGEATTRQP
jgi:tellurite resistance protein TerC